MAALTGGTLISSELGISLDELSYEHLGSCDRIVSDKTKTAIIGGSGDTETIAARVEFIKREKEKSESDFERGKLQNRLSKLLGGVAIIRVGAQSEIEMKEKKDRTDDAVLAIKAAIEEGIVAGGGAALLHCIRNVEPRGLSKDKLLGYNIVIDACKSPFSKIMINAGLDADALLKEFELVNRNIKSSNGLGYDVVSETFDDMIKLGIIDPTKVTRTALEKAVSVAGTLLTTESMVIFDKKSKDVEADTSHN
jgi:chaperonin GroEL